MKSSTIFLMLVTLFVVAQSMRVGWQNTATFKTGSSIQVNRGNFISVNSATMGSGAMGRTFIGQNGKQGVTQKPATAVRGRESEADRMAASAVRGKSPK